MQLAKKTAFNGSMANIDPLFISATILKMLEEIIQFYIKLIWKKMRLNVNLLKYFDMNDNRIDHFFMDVSFDFT